MDQDDLEFVHMNPERSFHAVMQDLQQQYPQPDAIFHTGDLARIPVAETYQRYLQFMQTLNTPHFRFRAIMMMPRFSHSIYSPIRSMQLSWAIVV